MEKAKPICLPLTWGDIINRNYKDILRTPKRGRTGKTGAIMTTIKFNELQIYYKIPQIIAISTVGFTRLFAKP